MKRKRSFLLKNAAKLPSVMDLATEKVLSFPDMSGLVAQMKLCFDEEGLEGGYESMLKLLRLECTDIINDTGYKLRHFRFGLPPAAPVIF